MTHTPCVDSGLVKRASEILDILKKRDLTIVTAESCTAGLISAVLSQADGAGELLHGSFVVYTKLNKTMALGVDRRLLANEGSINAEVVRQLAGGALERSPASLALAVSGVLGPSPDEDGNPVGLVYLCCWRRTRHPRVERKEYGSQPHDVLRRKVVLDAFDMISDFAEER